MARLLADAWRRARRRRRRYAFAALAVVAAVVAAVLGLTQPGATSHRTPATSRGGPETFEFLTPTAGGEQRPVLLRASRSSGVSTYALPHLGNGPARYTCERREHLTVCTLTNG